MAGRQVAPEERKPGAWMLRYSSPPPEGLEFVLELSPGAPLELRVITEAPGLPSLAGAASLSRPAGWMPAPLRVTDSSLVTRRFTL